ncbi:MAG: class I SAM-dependent methyltransferase [Promethearchaeota archaeon]
MKNEPPDYYTKKFQRFYDNMFSRFYDLFVKFMLFGLEKKLRLMIFNMQKFYNNDKILDLCCGTGAMSFLIAEMVRGDVKILGVDLSDGQLREATKKNKYKNVKFMKMNALKLNFEDNYFTKVIISLALHEMPREVRYAVLKEVKRVLKPNGLVTIIEHNEPSRTFWRIQYLGYIGYWLPFSPEAETSKDLVRHGLVRELIESGFEIYRYKKVSEGLKHFFQIAIAKKVKIYLNFDWLLSKRHS